MTGVPLVVGHGAANSPEALARARPHADVVEADVHRFRGRLEVRHAKTMGPVPLLWEGRRILHPRTRRPPLDEVLAYLDGDGGVALMLDLKGPDPALARAVLAATAARRAGPGLYACARHWPTADALRGAPGVTVLHSVGGARGLRALLRRYRPGDLEGVSVHRDLLGAGVVSLLRERAAHVWTWPVDDLGSGRALARIGVTGLISNDPAALGPLRARGEDTERAAGA